VRRALAITPGATRLRGGAAFGVAAGILLAAGDIATKAAVSGGDHLAVAPAVVCFYAAGTIVLQMGFQRGRALTTAGIATLGTNAIPIAAAMSLFAEPLPDGPLGLVRVASFAAVVAGAVALAPRRTTTEREPTAPPAPTALRPRPRMQAAAAANGARPPSRGSRRAAKL
jgi:hypothetical protein